MEQLVARWAHNPKVVGSSPAPATKKSLCKHLFYRGILFSQKRDRSPAPQGNFEW